MSVTNDDDIQTASNIAIIEGLMTRFGVEPFASIDRFYDTCKDRLGGICDMHLSMEDGNMNDDCIMSDVRKLIKDVQPDDPVFHESLAIAHGLLSLPEWQREYFDGYYHWSDDEDDEVAA